MKILGLITSPTDPASRARIMQYKNYFGEAGVELTPRFFSPFREADPAPWTYKLKKLTTINEWRTANIFKSLARLPLLIQQYNYDIIWQNRLVLPHHFFFENKFSKPLVFDFDDAIWLNEGEKQVKAAISRAAMVFVGNHYLAEYASKFNKNINIIPTTIDTIKLFPLNNESENFNIGWIGSESNFKYLEIIKPAVLDFLSKNNDSRFTIVSSTKPPQLNFDNNQVIFKQWSADKENELINEFSVGLMPLENNNWTKGKCSYKMLQYMACGKPVIVSPVGMNNQLLAAGDIGYAAVNQQDWFNAIAEIKNNKKAAMQNGNNGRELVERDYSCTVMSTKIINLFNTIKT
ncbi:MAG: glycosyltransferase [Chitinophagaceae bacterium]